MAVYTEIGTRELSAFIEDYDVGALLSSKGIAEGIENSNYLIHTEQANFILTLYEKRVDPGDLPFFLSLMHHLADKGVSCPVPIYDKSGTDLRTLAGRPAAMVSFLEGMSVRRPKVKHCALLGQTMAGLHLAGLDFGMSRVNALSVNGWGELLAQSRGHADDIRPGLAKEMASEFEYLKANWPNDLPTGIVHADLFPDNVFFIGDTLSGLIDFYFACTDQLAYDIAICLNAWCFEEDHEFNVTKARALLNGYRQVRKLEPREIAALPLLARGAALRFLLTRVYDWVNTPSDALVRPKNPMEYVTKLRFHRSVKSAGEYGIDL